MGSGLQQEITCLTLFVSVFGHCSALLELHWTVSHLDYECDTDRGFPGFWKQGLRKDLLFGQCLRFPMLLASGFHGRTSMCFFGQVFWSNDFQDALDIAVEVA